MAPEPLDEDLDQARIVEEFQALLISEHEFWTSTGLDLSGFTIIEAAADLNDLRQALGYDKVTLWGGSFGSHWAMAVLRYYPETVERAVLPRNGGPGPYL